MILSWKVLSNSHLEGNINLYLEVNSFRSPPQKFLNRRMFLRQNSNLHLRLKLCHRKWKSLIIRLEFSLARLVILYGFYKSIQVPRFRSQGMLMLIHILPPRPVELIGTSKNISMAEKLIKDVIAEADAGGSPSLVARGFCMVQVAGTVEQVLIQVPNEKVGVIIGKGGETIKNLQTRLWERIQLIPQHLPDGDQSKKRTVRVAGDKK